MIIKITKKFATFGMPSVPHWRNWNCNTYDYCDHVCHLSAAFSTTRAQLEL